MNMMTILDAQNALDRIRNEVPGLSDAALAALSALEYQLQDDVAALALATAGVSQ